jgi:hypothetical protein
MKKLLFSVAVLTFASTVFAQTTPVPVAPAVPKATIESVAKFTSETIDFGKIRQGTPTKGTFILTNISTAPIIIEQANPTCGCTISDYTKAPIAPGQTGVINATYNAANAGHFEKHLTVKLAGIDEIKSIVFTGEVLPAAEYDTWKAAFDARQKVIADSIAAIKPLKHHRKKAAAATTPAPTN